MAIMSIIWNTSEDDRVCPICEPLDNFVWKFDTAKEPFPRELWSHRHGVKVWDCIRDEPRPHGAHRLNCRCWLTVDWDVTSLDMRLQLFKARILELHGQIEQWTSGTRLVLRSQGRFVAWRTT